MNRGIRIGALVLLWLIPIFIFSWAFSWDWLATWRKLHIPSALPHFLDLNSIPTGVEFWHRGGDPFTANPLDPLRRPFNYPRVWLYLFSALGITRGNVDVVGLLFCVLYLGCISYLIVKAEHFVDVIFLLFASLSLAPLLGIERGNNDLFIFSLLFVGCVTSNKSVKSGIFAAAALLKIYPVAGLTIDAIRRPEKQREVPYILLAVVFVLFALQWYDVILIAHNTPIALNNSYGVAALREHFYALDHRWGILNGRGWLVIVGCWIAGALTIAAAAWNRWRLDDSIRNSPYAEMFSVFAGMYVFTYALGSNFDYRLILLLPTIPLALEMSRTPRHRVWGLAHLLLTGLAINAFGIDESAGHLAKLCIFLWLLAFLTMECRPFLQKGPSATLAEAQ
jgi:hypothetical protein